MTPSAGAAETGTAPCAGARMGDRMVAGPAIISSARNFESSFDVRRMAGLLLDLAGTLSRLAASRENRDWAWS
jgi:hypothetical protein